MEQKLKQLRTALIVVRILNIFGGIAAMFGFIGLVGVAGALETDPEMSTLHFFGMSLICLALMCIGALILDNLDGVADILSDRIKKLKRRMTRSSAMKAHRQIDAENDYSATRKIAM